MVRKRRRHTAACKFRAALKALEGSKTISRCLHYRTPAEERFVL